IDFAGPLNGEYYFVLVDAFSKWPEIVPTQTITAQQTIEILQEIFARFGVPESLVSDNGTQFTSEKFQNFCLLQGIKKAENAFWSFGDLPMIVVGYGASAEVLPVSPFPVDVSLRGVCNKGAIIHQIIATLVTNMK
ncbi:Uncharacterized protein K02A2.6, partial [Cyphomyrmex costatus]